jgi:hypothetical protein
MRCLQCPADVPEDEFLCPECGAAVIPQTTKTQSMVANMALRGRGTKWTIRGGLIGLSIGIAGSLLTYLGMHLFGNSAFKDYPSILMLVFLFVTFSIAILGAMAGLTWDLILSVRRKV